MNKIETYGNIKGFNFFNFFKTITAKRKGWIELHKKVSLDLDSHEEEQ